ncbi:MAG: SDR family oxidoreductase [Bryobacteraceae bacterium]|nr:SDR family oxidoreductase [Bryobacteraceae bacterium]
MSKFVVTGGAGFIGSCLVRELIKSGVECVTVLDNLSSGKRANLEEVRDHVDLHVIDICDYEAIKPVLAGAERVFHLAAIPSVPKSIVEPVESHESNIDGTFNVLRACQEGGVGRVIYAASSSAYGDTEVLPKVETMKPMPLSPYALQKLVGEYYCSVFTKCWGLETVALRFFNVFGPRQDPTSQYSGVLSIFMTCVLEGRAPTIFGDGEQSRDFTYVEDVAGLLIKASTAPAAIVSGNSYNAGNGGRFTLNETWRELCAIEGVKIEPEHGPDRAGDVKHSQADTTAACRDLGHEPRFTFAEGLRKTLEWYRASLVKA